MYGNVGQIWVQIKKIDLNGLVLNEVGSNFTIQNYYSVPHGYASIKYNDILLFIPDKVFEECFVPFDKYKQYYTLGDCVNINANGNLRTYTIENIDGDGHYITLSLEATD
jgi:hypothetical protein